MRKTLLLALIALFLLVSCHPQTEVSTDYDTPETWAELFDIFWSKMSSNYIFWNLDYDEGKGWDDAYDQYHPLFEQLGDIDEEDSSEAFRYFFELTKPLSDGHYVLDINVESSYFRSYPSYYRRMSGMGFSDDDIFNLFYSYDGSSYTLIGDELYGSFYDLMAENQSYILTNVLRKSGYSGTQHGPSPNDPLTLVSLSYEDEADAPFSKLEYIYIFDDPVNDDFLATLGVSEDNIVYLGLYDFYFYYYGTEYYKSHPRPATTRLDTFLEDYRSALDGASGVIIDLRGNPGGYLHDLQELWSAFTDGHDVHFADSRRKDGDNRLDYGVWLSMEIEDDGYSFDSSIPIAILVNSFSASCSECTLLFFKALSDDYGYDVNVIGETTAGATGALADYPYSELYYNAGCTEIEPYITTMYTPFTQIRYKDGTIYEGIGITPDEVVEFDYDAFISGTDGKLERALEWIREEL